MWGFVWICGDTVPKNKKKILITIDDGFLSFYKNAWPVLKKNKIPFILFVSTKEVGSSGYMNWEQISELNKIVVDYCISNVYNETKGYLKYLHDASTMHTPIDHPTQSGCYNKSLTPNPFI